MVSDFNMDSIGGHVKKTDMMIIGHVSRDIMIDHRGSRQDLTGGAVVYASAAAARSSATVLCVTKVAEQDLHVLKDCMHRNIEWYTLPTGNTTSIKNTYLTEDKEKRKVELLNQASAFRLDELPDSEAGIFYCAGLFSNEIPDSFIIPLSKRGKLAVDAQGLLRCNEDGRLVFRDWKGKHSYLKHIGYFKVDAAEAEILTGISSREEAALQLSAWGAGEVMLTHNEEVIVCDGERIYRAPYSNRNSSGRTGRGDTTFGSYLAWRRNHSIDESVKYATALCSMKMEEPGIFTGTIDEVLERM